MRTAESLRYHSSIMVSIYQPPVAEGGAAEPAEFRVYKLGNLHMACNLRHRPMHDWLINLG